ncbi:MAG: N-acetylmuramoyl-L-alanine amidase-like domain-containing protein [Candidatus Kapaibacterium sp.]
MKHARFTPIALPVCLTFMLVNTSLAPASALARANADAPKQVLSHRVSDTSVTSGTDRSVPIADTLFAVAEREGWKGLETGEIMAMAGLRLVGTPYVGGTLESEGPEQCVVNLTALDCVTLFENMLAFARCVQAGRHDLQAMRESVEWTRYRNGKRSGYASRLHYTGDWIVNNIEKDVVTDVTRSLGGIPFPLHVDFMSSNPRFYKALQRDSGLITVIAAQERTLSARRHWYIPKDKVAAIEKDLRSGDIIAITTSKSGLDYAHTGMICRTDDGVAHFLHASSAKKKVVLDAAISEVLATVPTHTGITVVRPLSLNTRHRGR